MKNPWLWLVILLVAGYVIVGFWTSTKCPCGPDCCCRKMDKCPCPKDQKCPKDGCPKDCANDKCPAPVKDK